MALEILNLKKVTDNGLLSKIQIGGKTYEIKDLIARENIETLDGLIATLSAKVEVLEKSGYDDTEVRGLITALQKAAEDLEANKADKTQVAADIKAAVDAEAAIARAAEKANADEIARVDAALKLAVENNEDGIDSIKELANWVNTHGAAAENMTKAITKNAEDIAAMDAAYKAADEAIDGRLDAVEAALGEGEGSVADQIADAKQEAIDAAKGYTDGEIDKVEAELAKKEDKTNLKALAYKDSATGTVAGQTISGVKATGTSAGSITVELEQTSHAMNSTGKYTPAGNVTGTVKTAGSIAVTAKHEDVNATLTKGDYTPAGEVSVALSGNSFNAITGVGTQASFVEGAFTPAALDHEAVSANYVEEALVGSVVDECLTFTAAATKALSASKVKSFSGGSKDADQFTANSLPTMAAQTVGVQSASFTGTKVEDLVVTGVSYKKADINTATFTGETVDIAATFAGTEGDVAVAGTCHDYAVKTAQFNPAAIEVAVGDIVVAEKSVTVQ